ncbi:Crp/Fnr family transcriptional regulator [Chitinophaga sp. SYP-B3965]|uniref:Crp/Fnr family transcriptional regulator n=1 Tax=Chitinophaga sp. SYP-B3965 TaxID=2663120 RepID=UPI001299A666|nr:Crp/Fnr family transcriptional regulator [Chitinophaga sp. SYP-B3965]MRG46703.1 Crp/Fnr family transcriptional regulator [Chitinophaga sp. SYP-B3965]
MSEKQPQYNIHKSASKLSIEIIEAIYKVLFERFNMIYPVSEDLWNSIIRHSQVKVFKKKQHMLEIGKINRDIHFIFSGTLWAYYVGEKGERISWFLIEGDMAISVVSFHNQIKSYEGIYVHEEAICISMSHEMLQWHYANFVEFNVIGLQTIIPYHVKDNVRVYSSIMEDATERYNRLLETIPDIFTRVPANRVASYLDISAETLSRIRAGKY